MAYLLKRYFDALLTLPPSGGGGCHQALLGVANFGVMAGLEDEQILTDIREYVDDTLRAVSDQEIREAIYTARLDFDHPSNRQHRRAQRQNKPKLPDGSLERILASGRGACEADFLKRSPVPIPEDPREHAALLLRNLYQPEDVLFMGGREDGGFPDRTIRRVSSILSLLRLRAVIPPHIIPNPLTGGEAPTRTGEKMTRRGDRCVRAFRFAVVEFDNLSKEDQLAFWASAGLPVHILLDSGGKSIHGWVRIDGVKTLTEWEHKVKLELFGDLLIPLGVDGACKNAARLSRMPGHLRAGKIYQRLLYLDPEGGEFSL
ncbi:MAG: hypothetical protein AB7F21_07065 [Desulfuromonadales bacterium]